MARKSKKRTKKIRISDQSMDGSIDPSNYINKETAWLEFNRRVLNEAKDARTPLLERLRFLSIFTSNLDEFFMKRVGGLKRLKDADISIKSVDGRSPTEQLKLIDEMIKTDLKDLHRTFLKIEKELNAEGVRFLEYQDLNEKQVADLKKYFKKMVFPVLTPLLVDPGHPFPFISNLSNSLAISLRNPVDDSEHFCRLKVPNMLPTWVKVSYEKHDFVNLSQIIANNLLELFPGMKIDSVMAFRVTRNAEFDQDDDEADDLLELISEGLKERKFAECVRLEVFNDCKKEILDFLVRSLELTHENVYHQKGKLLDYTEFKEILSLDFPKFKYPTWVPRVPKKLEDDTVNIFEKIKQSDILVHHPYESFSKSVEQFVVTAAKDPDVLAIKMTLYRTGDDSPFVEALKYAAESGKQVVCLIELKARFDESRNIKWAQALENSGVHVVYGLLGLKTHSKLALVIRRESEQEIKSYTHIGTGNYHSQTSNLYTDLGLLTCEPEVCNEVIEVFNYLTGISLKTNYKKLLLAPINMKSTFLKLISRETKLASEGKKCKIIAKMNQMDDINIIQALYEASNAGVEITLFIRGFCSLRPGVKGLSENIKVISIIGRFLEHSRVFYFSGGNEKLEEGEYFIGSADWMHRNLHKRVEAIVPIESIEARRELAYHFEVLLSDNRQSWLMKEDGSYEQRKGAGNDSLTGTHDVFIKKYRSLLKTAKSL